MNGAEDGRPFEPGNVVALKHGATSERRISRRTTVEKRRALRQMGLRQNDFEALGKTLLHNWSRSAAVLSLERKARDAELACAVSERTQPPGIGECDEDCIAL